MPEGIEYLHAVQAALDAGGLRYQVLDAAGQVREWLAWPLTLPSVAKWTPLVYGENDAPVCGERESETTRVRMVAIRFSGRCPSGGGGEAQTLLCGWNPGPTLAPLWIGLKGPERRVGVLLSPAPGRSPHLWLGPALSPGEPFEIEVAIHGGMGPGGLLWRWNVAAPWSSLVAASPWGAERLVWPTRWSVGHDQRGAVGRPFRGRDLQVTWHAQELYLEGSDNGVSMG
jgi:hypothetical protein